MVEVKSRAEDVDFEGGKYAIRHTHVVDAHYGVIRKIRASNMCHVLRQWRFLASQILPLPHHTSLACAGAYLASGALSMYAASSIQGSGHLTLWTADGISRAFCILAYTVEIKVKPGTIKAELSSARVCHRYQRLAPPRLS